MTSEQRTAPSRPSWTRASIDFRTYTDWSMTSLRLMPDRVSFPSISLSEFRRFSTTPSVLAPSCRKTGMYTSLLPSTRTTFVWMKLASLGVATSRRYVELPGSIRTGMSPMSFDVLVHRVGVDGVVEVAELGVARGQEHVASIERLHHVEG